MTVKDAVKVLKRATKIQLIWAGDSLEFNKENALMMAAYGNYVVDEITMGYPGESGEEENYEITVAMQPMKVGA